MRSHTRWIPLALLAGCSAPASAPGPFPEPGALAHAPLPHHLPVTTRTAEVQRLFDAGLAWCWVGHRGEARRCFGAALQREPDCAMAWWGLAYADGPDRDPCGGGPGRPRAAWDSARAALERSERLPTLERGLIEALAVRQVRAGAEDDPGREDAYVDLMRAVHLAYPDELDVAVLFAEALLDRAEGVLWASDGSPLAGTDELLVTLERVLEVAPEHPQANHLYVHAVARSPVPELALACGERLRALETEAGHPAHLATHVDLRLGRYGEAVRTGLRARDAERALTARLGPEDDDGAWSAHALATLLQAAFFAGRAELALEVAGELDARGATWAIPQALLRFGRYEDLVAAAEPTDAVGRVVHRAARALALATLARTEEAGDELDRARSALDEIEPAASLGRDPARDVAAVGLALADGVVQFRRGEREAAFAALRRAVALRDALSDDVPASWMVPPRHALAALLFESGRMMECEETLRRDLERHPESGWALRGLADCLRLRGATDEAAEAEARFVRAWADADVTLRAPSFCARGAAAARDPQSEPRSDLRPDLRPDLRSDPGRDR